MARVLGPNNVQITSAVGGAPTRASGEDFGAQVGAAQQKFGSAMEKLGAVGQIMDDKRAKAEEASFLDKADLELDLTYGKIFQDEQAKATSGADGMTNTVRSRLEGETEAVFDSLREKGFRPSEETMAKARGSLAIRRQHQYIKSSMIYENNERVRNFAVQLDGSLSTIAQSGVQSGDIDSALARADQSIEAHRGILPAAQLDQMRVVAAKHFFDQTMASGDPEAVQGLMEKLSRGKPQAATEEGQPAAAAKSISPAGLAAIKREEGYTSVAKWDIRQNSVGYGTKGTRGERITKEEAERRLTVETGKVSQFINDNVTVPLNQGQHDALVSFGFNLGTDDIEKLLPDINSGNFDRVAERMKQFNKALNEESGRLEPLDGLTKRRQSEAQMFLGGGAAAAPVSDTIGGAFAGMLREKAPQIQKAVDEVREKRADAQRANLILSGQLLVDPGSKDDKAVIDKAFAASDLAGHLRAADPTAAATVTGLAKRYGYVPDDSMSALRAMAVNGQPGDKMYAYEVAANIMREKPGIFEGGNVKELKADATLYETYTTDMGLSPEVAITRIGELRSPEFEKRREAVKKDLEINSSVMKQVTGDDLTKEFDGWFSSAPALGGSPGQAAVIVDTYRDLVKDNYVKTGDIEVAKAMAKKDLLRTYAVSEVTGKKRLMRNKPENYYPAIEPRAGKEPDHSYFTDQLKDSVRQVAGKDVPIGDIYIEPVPQTNSDIRAQRYPGYGVVWFEERDGVRVMQSAPGMVFRADVKAEQERVKANTAQRIRDDRSKEVERRKAIENSAPRKAFKASKAMIQNLINPPGGGPAYSDTQTQPDGAVAF